MTAEYIYLGTNQQLQNLLLVEGGIRIFGFAVLAIF